MPQLKCGTVPIRLFQTPLLKSSALSRPIIFNGDCNTYHRANFGLQPASSLGDKSDHDEASMREERE